jgi:ABC-type lipoprotein export system ATPase subunit
MSDRTAEASPTAAIAAALVTHDPVAASFADRVVVLADGRACRVAGGAVC